MPVRWERAEGELGSYYGHALAPEHVALYPGARLGVAPGSP